MKKNRIKDMFHHLVHNLQVMSKDLVGKREHLNIVHIDEIDFMCLNTRQTTQCSDAKLAIGWGGSGPNPVPVKLRVEKFQGARLRPQE